MPYAKDLRRFWQSGSATIQFFPDEAKIKGMDEKDFEGSLLLEQLASMGLIDDFFEAVDSDNIQKIISLLRDAEIDEEAISMVLKSM